MPGEAGCFLHLFCLVLSEYEKSLTFALSRKSEDHCTGGRPEGERVRVEEGARRMLRIVDIQHVMMLMIMVMVMSV